MLAALFAVPRTGQEPKRCGGKGAGRTPSPGTKEGRASPQPPPPRAGPQTPIVSLLIQSPAGCASWVTAGPAAGGELGMGLRDAAEPGSSAGRR